MKSCRFSNEELRTIIAKKYLYLLLKNYSNVFKNYSVIPLKDVLAVQEGSRVYVVSNFAECSETHDKKLFLLFLEEQSEKNVI